MKKSCEHSQKTCHDSETIPARMASSTLSGGRRTSPENGLVSEAIQSDRSAKRSVTLL